MVLEFEGFHHIFLHNCQVHKHWVSVDLNTYRPYSWGSAQSEMGYEHGSNSQQLWRCVSEM